MPHSDSSIQLPPDIASGVAACRQLRNGSGVLLLDFSAHTEIVIQRKKARHPVYILRFEQIETSTDNQTRSSVSISYATTDWTLTAAEKQSVKCVHLFVPKKLFHLLLQSAEGTTVKNFLLQNSNQIELGALNVSYKKLLRPFFELPNCEGLNNLVLQNRMMLLTEKLIEDVFGRLKPMRQLLKVSADEVRRLCHVESILKAAHHRPPPTIDVLAIEAAMSPSKLKQRFKMVYGISLYQYYQRHRMEKARLMLLGRNASVPQVAKELGFIYPRTFLKVYTRYFEDAVIK